MSTLALHRRDTGCEEPLRRLAYGLYEHRGYQVAWVIDAWHIRANRSVVATAATLRTALRCVDAHPRPAPDAAEAP
jgi:hypothetical protein